MLSRYVKWNEARLDFHYVAVIALVGPSVFDLSCLLYLEKNLLFF